MASTGLDQAGAAQVRSMNNLEKNDGTPMVRGIDNEAMAYSPGEDNCFKPTVDSTHRILKPRHIQLIGIGGFVNTIAYAEEDWC